MITGLIVGAVILLLVIFFIASWNTLVHRKNQCAEAFATMDVYLKKRFDLIPNLVATVKGYAKHESETLEKVIEARNAGQRGSINEKIEDEKQISGALRQIFALSESYPDLKANTNFVELQGQLAKIEETVLE